MNEKRYPFNMNKHQHEIFFRYNRAKNDLYDKFMNGILTEKEEARYEDLIGKLSHLLDYGCGIVWLTGKEYGLAQETVGWAAAMRRH